RARPARRAGSHRRPDRGRRPRSAGHRREPAGGRAPVQQGRRDRLPAGHGQERPTRRHAPRRRPDPLVDRALVDARVGRRTASAGTGKLMKDKLDGLCEAFVMAEVGDRPALRALRHRVDDVLQDAVDARMVEALTGLGRTLDRLLAGADPDPDGSWKSVEETLLVLQGLAQVPAGAPPEIDADLFGGFVVEAREHLEAAEAQLLALEADPSQVEAIHTVFRAFHTIKGAASCLDLATLQALAHETENLLDLARKGAIPMSGGATD